MNEVSSLSKMNKRVKSATFVSGFQSIFKCPICESSMNVHGLKSLICSNKHTFDFTKQGYINLVPHPLKTRYGKELFEARRKLIAADDFFAPLSMAISEVIKKQNDIKKETLFILDMGCGEGSHLSNICDIVSTDLDVTGVGIDLSKEGIFVASKNYSNKIWAVADIANAPFKDTQFDVILNILSPSNYQEFKRLLKDDGLLVKVVPQSGYLMELRGFFLEPEKQSYSNADTVERFNEKFQVVGTSRLTYTVTLEKPSIESLIQMTPLTWSMPNEKIKSFLEMDSVEITVDLEILIGKAI